MFCMFRFKTKIVVSVIFIKADLKNLIDGFTSNVKCIQCCWMRGGCGGGSFLLRHGVHHELDYFKLFGHWRKVTRGYKTLELLVYVCLCDAVSMQSHTCNDVKFPITEAFTRSHRDTDSTITIIHFDAHLVKVTVTRHKVVFRCLISCHFSF